MNTKQQKVYVATKLGKKLLVLNLYYEHDVFYLHLLV